jgi:HD superfamily phosphodiesterase
MTIRGLRPNQVLGKIQWRGRCTKFSLSARKSIGAKPARLSRSSITNNGSSGLILSRSAPRISAPEARSSNTWPWNDGLRPTPCTFALYAIGRKEIQDSLGEIHDLDVLWATALSCRVFPDAASRNRWHARILTERNKRIARYREKMVGPNSLWQVWRAGLPQGKQIQALATRRMKLWAYALDPDFAHSERVAKLSLELYDGLTRAGFFASGVTNPSNSSARSSLLIAALLHDVGKSKGNKGHHKASLDLIKSHEAPLGYNNEDMRRAAIVARFHCGALPIRSHKALRDLFPDEQQLTIQLAAVLRLANALDAEHDGHIRRVLVEKEKANGIGRIRPGCVVLDAEGYSARNHTARKVAAERHLLETVLRRPVMIKAMKNQAARIGP